jgi:hypothetical protein
MSAMPSLTVLQAALFQEFRLEDGVGNHLPVILQSALPGIAMSAKHVCYAMELLLPPGARVGQGTYRLRHPMGESWDLFMSPILPHADGRHRLEAVIHRERTVDDTMPVAMAAGG